MTKKPELKSWKYYLSDPGKKPDCLVLMLHGCAGNADDVLSFASFLQKNTAGKSFVAVAPDAFLPSAEKSDGYQWFDIENNYAKNLFASPYEQLSEAEKKMFKNMADGEQGMKSASETLNAFLDFCQKKFGLDDSQTILFGYSQGAMQALDMGISRAGTVRAIVALSGCLIPPDKEELKNRIVSRPDILLLHGSKDNVINFNAALQTEKILKENGFNVRLRAQNGMGHGRGAESAAFWAKAAWHTAEKVNQEKLLFLKKHFAERNSR